MENNIPQLDLQKISHWTTDPARWKKEKTFPASNPQIDGGGGEPAESVVEGGDGHEVCLHLRRQVPLEAHLGGLLMPNSSFDTRGTCRREG